MRNISAGEWRSAASAGVGQHARLSHGLSGFLHRGLWGLFTTLMSREQHSFSERDVGL